jgi:predicted transcriptional regulator
MNLEKWLKKNGIPTEKNGNVYKYQMARQFQDCWVCAVRATKERLSDKMATIDFKNNSTNKVNEEVIDKLQEFLKDELQDDLY